MPELYASIPSPEINFSEANTYKDQDLHARLRGYEDLVGVRATLHQYQTVSLLPGLRFRFSLTESSFSGQSP